MDLFHGHNDGLLKSKKRGENPTLNHSPPLTFITVPQVIVRVASLQSTLFSPGTTNVREDLIQKT
jgi:hypothetical protein